MTTIGETDERESFLNTLPVYERVYVEQIDALNQVCTFQDAANVYKAVVEVIRPVNRRSNSLEAHKEYDVFSLFELKVREKCDTYIPLLEKAQTVLLDTGSADRKWKDKMSPDEALEIYEALNGLDNATKAFFRRTHPVQTAGGALVLGEFPENLHTKVKLSLKVPFAILHPEVIETYTK